jgi:hypothetical protein
MQLWSYAALLIVILAALFLASFLLGIINLVGTIRDTLLSPELLDSVTKSLGTIRDGLLALLEIILILALLYLLYSLWSWIRRDDNDVFIQPFIVGACGGKYNGAAISDLLIEELLRIQSIYETKNIIEESRRIAGPNEAFVLQLGDSTDISGSNILGLPAIANSKTSFALPSFTPGSMNIAYNVSSSITISGGTITMSVDQILAFLKKISGHSGRIITGSIQEYGSTIFLVAWMDTTKKGAWKVRQNTEETSIPNMLSDLAFKIAWDITKNDIKAKTWRGLKFYTEALDEYNLYKLYGLVERLGRSHELCRDAIEAERNYSEPANLLSDIGNEYIKTKRYSEAEMSFRDAIHLKPGANNFYGLGVALSR